MTSTAKQLREENFRLLKEIEAYLKSPIENLNEKLKYISKDHLETLWVLSEEESILKTEDFELKKSSKSTEGASLYYKDLMLASGRIGANLTTGSGALIKQLGRVEDINFLESEEFIRSLAKFIKKTDKTVKKLESKRIERLESERDELEGVLTKLKKKEGEK